ncbi:Holliday junction branch migration protein RuvA [Anaeromyxobacter sp. Fw109-5]|uniref:Holliday junction branch migration complex subunit RuvA n=1 Tax=Anaeromyxobacter sp. (strain Fw109-5) TaxID=404589 RepID=RUVA_ANADF|nr:Holliday junction branch migration protein RuvA [Anaeromyxobacter sp. Fw109-5]A7H906.1 RecName: Full=Holliday junction branch migration complex subunit RuvA [Anaeromyxobacter sp. Fw109-5]ABS25202.1 Holliday junction DNA helicase RuvA [Anaeromyxobacter sp. Fw109-5]
MIARLAGKVAEKGADHVVLDVGGVGYLVHLSAVSLAGLPPQGGDGTLRIFTNVRQDAIELYGFASEDEEAVFRALIDVKGVGPRAAQNILSGIDARELAQAVAGSDVARLTKVPGIGKKTAERLVVELKEKLALLARAAGPARAKPGAGVVEQLRQALVNLGYKPPQADAAADALRDEAEGKKLDELLREALKRLRG